MKTIKTFKTLTGTMLMSIIAATAFTACADDRLDDNSSNSSTDLKAGEQEVILKPIGLCHQDFITPGDVQILNADTTEIAVSKALADKLGITEFVNHPMGIWQKMGESAYLRRATAQKLVGDRYILQVVPSTIGEVMNGQVAELSTMLYVNPDAQQTRSEGGVADYSRYVDASNTIHPAAVKFIAMPGEDPATRGALSDYGTYTPEQILSGELATRGFLDDLGGAFSSIGNTIKKGAEQAVNTVKKGAETVKNVSVIGVNMAKTATYAEVVNQNKRGSVISGNSRRLDLKKDFSFKCGKAEDDTINVHVQCPVDFELNYTFKLRGGTTFGVKPELKEFESTFDGMFGVTPQVQVGFHKKLETHKRIDLAKLGSYQFTFMIGPVPVTVDVAPYTYMTFDGKVEGFAYAGLKYEYAKSFKVGCRYNGSDWSKISESKVLRDDFSMTAMRASFDAEAGVGFYLGAEVVLCKVAGPKMSIGPSLKADAHMSYDKARKQQPVAFSARVQYSIGGEVGAKIKVWKWDIKEWKTDYSLVKDKTIWQYPGQGEKYAAIEKMINDSRDEFAGEEA